MDLNQENFLLEAAAFHCLFRPDLFDLFDRSAVAFGQSMNNFQHIRQLFKSGLVRFCLDVFFKFFKRFFLQFFPILFIAKYASCGNYSPQC